MHGMGLPSAVPRMNSEDSASRERDRVPQNSPSSLEDYESLPPIAPPRGMMKPKLKIYHWVLIALLLGGFVALLLVGLASD
jgi:hypothetical protein